MLWPTELSGAACGEDACAMFLKIRHATGPLRHFLSITWTLFLSGTFPTLCLLPIKCPRHCALHGSTLSLQFNDLQQESQTILYENSPPSARFLIFLPATRVIILLPFPENLLAFNHPLPFFSGFSSISPNNRPPCRIHRRHAHFSLLLYSRMYLFSS